MLPPKRITPATRRSRSGLEYVLGRRRAGEAQHEQLPDLLLERQLVGRAASLLALLESQKTEREKEPDDADDHRSYVVNSTTLPSEIRQIDRERVAVILGAELDAMRAQMLLRSFEVVRSDHEGDVTQPGRLLGARRPIGPRPGRARRTGRTRP